MSILVWMLLMILLSWLMSVSLRKRCRLLASFALLSVPYIALSASDPLFTTPLLLSIYLPECSMECSLRCSAHCRALSCRERCFLLLSITHRGESRLAVVEGDWEDAAEETSEKSLNPFHFSTGAILET